MSQKFQVREFRTTLGNWGKLLLLFGLALPGLCALITYLIPFTSILLVPMALGYLLIPIYVLVAYFFYPQAYRLDSDGFAIVVKTGRAIVPWRDIESAEAFADPQGESFAGIRLKQPESYINGLHPFVAQQLNGRVRATALAAHIASILFKPFKPVVRAFDICLGTEMSDEYHRVMSRQSNIRTYADQIAHNRSSFGYDILLSQDVFGLSAEDIALLINQYRITKKSKA